MKIQCDVCNKQQASLFCTADEAALCSTCDHRVHHANKLASKHHRFSLNHPASSNHFPLCDICHERRGFVFCQEDRAIVCRECDLKTHGENEHTKKHNRFLLSGIKLLSPAVPPLPTINNGSLVITNNEEASGSTGFTISEYLINTIPGWKFEDFLDSHSVIPFDQPQNHVDEDKLSSLVHDDDEEENMVYNFHGEGMSGMLVPQTPMSSLYCSSKMDDSSETNMEANCFKLFSSSSLGDDNFIVPQIT